jgi:acetoin utilization transport system permease protein
MFYKALWKKHYKQTKYLIWGFVFATFIYPFNILNEENRFKTMIEMDWFERSAEDYYAFEPSLFVSLFQILIIIGIATILIGLERSNQSMDFTLTLPYKRKEILLNKWFFGVVTIITANSISFIITSIILYKSILITFFPYQLFIYYFVASTIYLIGIYSFSLFIGQLVGNHFGQYILTWIFLMLPIGLFTLIRHMVIYHYDYFTHSSFSIHHVFYGYDDFAQILTMPISLIAIDFAIETAQIGGIIDPIRFYALILPIGITFLFIICSNYLSNHMNSENNGKLLVFKKLEKFFIIGVVICFYLLGGLLATSVMYPFTNLFIYHIGGFLSAAIAFVAVILLLGRRLPLGGYKNAS